MKHKFLVALLAVAATLCMGFGLSACKEKKPDETDNDPPIVEPSGGEQGSSGSGSQGGGEQKPDEGEQGSTQKPDEGEQEPEPYTEGLYFTEMYDEDGTTVIGYSVGVGEAVDKEEIVIPSKYNDLPVLSISRSYDDMDFWNGVMEEWGKLTNSEELLALSRKYTFYRVNLKKITIPDSVTEIGFSAFAECTGLTSVTIPDSVTSIETNAFVYCTELTNITIPNSVTEIGEYAFAQCYALTSVDIPNSVNSIGRRAFSECDKLKEVHFENPNGWKVSSSDDESIVSGLDDPEQAAIYLARDYSGYIWKREG